MLDFAEVWFRQVSTITFHDPLAAVTIFDDGVCGFERGRVNVEQTSEQLAGLTHWTADVTGPYEVALTVNVHRVFLSITFRFFKD